MTLADVLAGIGALITALGGIFLIVKELNRRERKASDKQIDSLVKQVDALRSDSLEYRSWAYGLTQRMVDAGMPVPPAPTPTPLAQDDEPEEKRRRLWRRKS